MKPLKYFLWAALSLTLIILVGVNALAPRPRITAQQDLDFDERAIC